MDTADRKRRRRSADRTLLAQDLTLASPGETTLAPADDSCQPPPDLKIHPRQRLPDLVAGREVPDPTPSPPIVLDER